MRFFRLYRYFRECGFSRFSAASIAWHYLIGLCQRATSRFWLLPGRKVTCVQWDGCMAHIRHVLAVGRILRWERHTFGDGSSFRGIIVRYPGGDRWEAMADIRFVGGALGSIEVWR